VETKDKICGFILIREYPGCSKKVGDFVPYTTGEFLGYPEIWMILIQNVGWFSFDLFESVNEHRVNKINIILDGIQ